MSPLMSIFLFNLIYVVKVLFCHKVRFCMGYFFRVQVISSDKALKSQICCVSYSVKTRRLFQLDLSSPAQFHHSGNVHHRTRLICLPSSVPHQILSSFNIILHQHNLLCVFVLSNIIAGSVYGLLHVV